MDELTIGDKIYISSKQAAKITGYAKDYVGQLCREGRVEARLVGRNWYVLESSIREHRFGSQSNQEFAAPGVDSAAEEVVSTPTSSWESPTYAAVETETLLPPLVTPQKPAMAPETTEAVALMQDAWKEWFAARERIVPPVQEEVISKPDEVEQLEVTEPEQEDIEEVRTSDMSSVYNVSEVSHAEEEGSRVSLTRVNEQPVEEYEEEIVPTRIAPRPASVAPSRVVGSVIDLSHVNEERYEPVIHSERIVRRSGKRVAAASLTMQAIFLSIAGLAIVIAVIGSGALDAMPAARGFNENLRGAIFDTLQGETQIKK